MIHFTNNKIIVESPIPIINVESFKIIEQYNEHSILYLIGYLKEYKGNDIDGIWEFKENSNIKIKLKTKKKELTLFSGIPMDIKITTIRELHKIELIIYSYSILLDIERKSRSFQNSNNLYIDIFKKIVGEYNGDTIYNLSKELAQNQFILQYEETDWEFLKRIASHQEGMLLPDILSEKPNVYVGIPKLQDYVEIKPNYSVSKNMEQYYIKNSNYSDSSELNFIEYTIKSNFSYNIGDKINYKDTKFEISEKISNYERGILEFTYKLKKSDGIAQNRIFNENITGLTLEGKVIDRKTDVLKVHLDIDSSQDLETAYWFKLSTYYTTTGNTGFYSVPQIGDTVKLYVPTMSEVHAFIRGGKRTDGAVSPKTQDVETKYFRQNHGNELMLSPTNVTFTAVDYETFIDLSKSEGIIATTKDDILITAKDISLSAGGSMFFGSREQLAFKKGDLNIIMREKMYLNG